MAIKLHGNTFGIEGGPARFVADEISIVCHNAILELNGQVGLSIQKYKNKISSSVPNYKEAPTSSCSSNSVIEGYETSDNEIEWSEGSCSSESDGVTETCEKCMANPLDGNNTTSNKCTRAQDAVSSEQESMSVDKKEHNCLRCSGIFVVKAKYGEDYVAFECPQSWTMEEVRDKVGNKLEIEPSRIKLMYMDSSNEVILMTNTTDFVNALRVTTERNDRKVRLWVLDTLR